jgi:hypothetical protein
MISGHRIEYADFKFEAVCERVECNHQGVLRIREWEWTADANYNIYAFYRREISSPKDVGVKLIGVPRVFEDHGGGFEQHIEELIRDFYQVYNAIIDIIPQPIAEEITGDIVWDTQDDYINILDVDVDVLKRIELHECVLIIHSDK